VLTRAALGLAVVLATVSASLAGPRAQANTETAGVIWGFPYVPAQGNSASAPLAGSRAQATVGRQPVHNSSADVAGPRSHAEPAGWVWGFPYVPTDASR
jgi:hypothetical protein